MASDRDGHPGRIKVLLDANALMMPVQFGIDLFTELERLLGSFEAFTLEDVRNELAGIAQGRGRDAAAARVGLALTERCTIVPSGDRNVPVDDRLVRYAREHHCLVVTNDRKLKHFLLENGVHVIIMRKQKTLEIVKD